MGKSGIYTRTGDQGVTGLADGARIDKWSQRVAALGAVDELNAAIGLAAAQLVPEDAAGDCLRQVQHALFVIGAVLAQAEGMQLPPESVSQLEACIDRFDAELPAMTHFILPGGCPAGAHLHLARTVCRRAEREVLRLGASEAVESAVSIYLNRLSDLLFVLARLVNQHAGAKEEAWKP
jgi:cob(I)alamin adenosyltransferase